MGISNMLPVNTSGLQLIKTQAVGTGVSSVTVTDVFSATYDNYRIIYSNFTASTNGSLSMQLNNSTGTTYQLSGIYLTIGSATVNGYGPAASTKWTDVSPAGTTSGYCLMDIFSPYLSSPTRARTTGNSGSGYYDFGAVDTSSNSNTGFILAHVTGGATLTGGTIRVYGYRN